MIGHEQIISAKQFNNENKEAPNKDWSKLTFKCL